MYNLFPITCIIINLFVAGLWSLVFLFSNLALFILLPFAHLFIESEGLPGSSKVSKKLFYLEIVLLF